MTLISIFLLIVVLISIDNLSGDGTIFDIKLADYIPFNAESKEKGGTG
jgi:hypothetical protein